MLDITGTHMCDSQSLTQGVSSPPLLHMPSEPAVPLTRTIVTSLNRSPRLLVSSATIHTNKLWSHNSSLKMVPVAYTLSANVLPMLKTPQIGPN